MFEARLIDTSVFAEARSRGLDPVMAQLLPAELRVRSRSIPVLNPQLQNIASPSVLKDIKNATDRLRLAISNGEYIGVLTDYDADGLTSHAVITHALLRFGVSLTNRSHTGLVID